MRVKLLVSRAGVDFSQQPGDVIELSAEEAHRMIESEQAEPVGGSTRVETATVAPVETASIEPARAKRPVAKKRGK